MGPAGGFLLLLALRDSSSGRGRRRLGHSELGSGDTAGRGLPGLGESSPLLAPGEGGGAARLLRIGRGGGRVAAADWLGPRGRGRSAPPRQPRARWAGEEAWSRDRGRMGLGARDPGLGALRGVGVGGRTVPRQTHGGPRAGFRRLGPPAVGARVGPRGDWTAGPRGASGRSAGARGAPGGPRSRGRPCRLGGGGSLNDRARQVSGNPGAVMARVLRSWPLLAPTSGGSRSEGKGVHLRRMRPAAGPGPEAFRSWGARAGLGCGEGGAAVPREGV